jgi:hypothetical protein
MNAETNIYFRGLAEIKPKSEGTAFAVEDAASKWKAQMPNTYYTKYK